jgi:hypothetical protein
MKTNKALRAKRIEEHAARILAGMHAAQYALYECGPERMANMALDALAQARILVERAEAMEAEIARGAEPLTAEPIDRNHPSRALAIDAERRLELARSILADFQEIFERQTAFPDPFMNGTSTNGNGASTSGRARFAVATARRNRRR